MATSRQPLGVSEEQVLPVPPLSCPAGSGPATVQQSEAGRLFLDRARAASPQFRLDEGAAAHVADICCRLDGLPLAIELAATRVRTLDLATLADSLTSQLRLLERPAAAGRHRSLAAAIEWSWELLDQDDRDLLGRLAALPGDFTVAMAQAAAEPWLEGSAWQARGLARSQTADAFRDLQQAAIRFVAAGDLMHASNVRYMLAHQAVESGKRLAEVPVWLDECESYAASHGYRHELAHIHYVRAVYERMQGRLEAARNLLDAGMVSPSSQGGEQVPGRIFSTSAAAGPRGSR